jgi:hypothetical protein
MRPMWSTVRGLSSKYQGVNHNVAIRRARAERLKSKSRVPDRNVPNHSPSVTPNKGVILRRNESTLSRYLGAAAGLHAIGAVAFCGVALRGTDVNKQPSAELSESDPPPLLRYLAVGLAITTTIGIFAMAARLRRGRLVEIRQTGSNVQLYTRSLRGFNELLMAHEVAVHELYVDFQKLRSAGKYVGMSESELKRVARQPGAALLNFSIRNDGGSTYAVDTRELCILDTQAIESVSVDLPEA